jgi:hypothetical protein
MTLPEGLLYVPGFLTEAEERDVLAVLATFELHPYVLHDTPSRRLVRSFGRTLVAGAYDAGPAAPIPAELEWVRERCAGLMGYEPRTSTGPGPVNTSSRSRRSGPSASNTRTRRTIRETAEPLAGLLQAVGLLARYSGAQVRRSVGVIKRGVAA